MTATEPRPLTPRERAQVDKAVARALANAPKDLPDDVIYRIAAIFDGNGVLSARMRETAKKKKRDAA